MCILATKRDDGIGYLGPIAPGLGLELSFSICFTNYKSSLDCGPSINESLQCFTNRCFPCLGCRGFDTFRRAVDLLVDCSSLFREYY